MATNPIKLDHATGFVQPVQDGRTIPSYPFLINGDIVTKIYQRELVQKEANYVPLKPGTELDSVWPGGDPNAYCLPDGPLQWTGVSDLMRFSRSYARLPAPQTIYGSRLFNRPVMHDVFSGGSYAVSFDNGETSHVFTSRKTVSSVGALTGGTNVAVAAQEFGVLPHTAFSIVDGGAHTSVNYLDDDVSTMQANIEGDLTDLTAVAVSAVPGGITIAWQGKTNWVTTAEQDVTIIGGAGIDGSVTFLANAPTVTDYQASAYPLRTINSTAHGGEAGDWCVLWNGDRIIGMVRVISKTTDAFVIPCADDQLTSSTLALTHCGFAPDAAARYVNGPVAVSVKEVTTFYLPGVTVGITTPSDIALIVPKITPILWLGEIVAFIAGGSLASYYSVIEGSQLEPWLGGPFYMQTAISAQMSDALDTVSVSA